AAPLLDGRKKVSQREVTIGPACFSQTVSYVAEARRLRVYGADISERKEAEQKNVAQLERLALMHQITRAIGERQDLPSIFQVVAQNLEDKLPLDFCCLCLHDDAANELTMVGLGAKSRDIAGELGIADLSNIPIDRDGLSRCVNGELVYEPDIGHSPHTFPSNLATAGLHSLVLAPLLVESRVFGVLVAARQAPRSFSSGECEFLRQLSEHVALASHQAQLYDALQKAYNDLRQTQQAVMQQERLSALGQMASGIAHDINNAISPVSLYTESLLENEPGLSEKARGYLTTIQNSIEDVAATVARMKEFYRQREPQLALAPLNIGELLQQVADLTRVRWSDMPQQQGIVIQLAMEIAPDLPPFMGVAGEIREALTNLVLNAADAMPDGGTLTLRARKQANYNGAPSQESVIAEVSDTGIGMDENTRHHCLEPFFTTKGERGTGLGLAMVYGVLQRHNAGIEIESAPGAGTTMRLDFPVPARTPASESSAGTEAAWTVPQRLRLLAVDDDPVVIESLRHILEDDGHVVTSANDGREGIAEFMAALERGEPFAAVITDLGMPYVDGRQVANTVKKLAPGTPVILLTGWGQRLVADGEVPANVDRVLTKPPRLRELRRALAACIPQPAMT
ncbi:MAG TPA: ATP-binding protein, partial [Chthoniobacteraceae bacterium]|nr:ATP-binding protein [Chthoniobacteraceae bacterium]